MSPYVRTFILLAAFLPNVLSALAQQSAAVAHGLVNHPFERACGTQKGPGDGRASTKTLLSSIITRSQFSLLRPSPQVQTVKVILLIMSSIRISREWRRRVNRRRSF